jgi:hypothetical protein
MSKKPGRPRGLPKTWGGKKNTSNKTTTAFRTDVLMTFEEIGGTEALVRWARRNPTEFYRICARLIPYEVIGPGDDGARREDHHPSALEGLTCSNSQPGKTRTCGAIGVLPLAARPGNGWFSVTHATIARTSTGACAGHAIPNTSCS